ncbi:MAG TPA: hypothetical protein VNA25_26000 [Phycisphaerae bacterium]|nr:hypothetical protein [Phycisphaerae bacterium]
MTQTPTTEQEPPSLPTRRRVSVLLIVGLICLALGAAAALHWGILYRRAMLDWTDQMWDQARQMPDPTRIEADQPIASPEGPNPNAHLAMTFAGLVLAAAGVVMTVIGIAKSRKAGQVSRQTE